MNCINCGTGVTDKFCPHCGQPNPSRKLTFGNLYHDFQARIYGVDGMFPRTLRDVTLRPGKASLSFIEGNRVLYYGPVGYFFLMITVLLLIMSILDIDLVTFMMTTKNPISPGIKPGSGQERFTQAMFKFVTDNIKLFSFAMVPLQAFVSRYFFFRKSGYGFLEHSVLPFYVQGHIYWLTILSVICFKISGYAFPNAVVIVISLFYFGFAYANLFDRQSKIKTFLKGLGIYFTAQVLFVLIIILGLVIIAFLFPDVYQMIKPSNNK
jgi:Protein of unknown function (DUF3667)